MTCTTMWFARKLLYLLVTIIGTILAAVNALAEPLSVYTHSGSREGFYSNSHLLISEDRALLIDVQFTIDDARDLVTVIQERKLVLDAIVVTHPHPDHYYGLEFDDPRIAEAKIIAGPITAAIVQQTLGQWAAQQPDVPAYQRRVHTLPTTTNPARTLLFQGSTLTMTHWENRESVENTVIHVPGIAALFTGDLVSNGFHLWLAEGRINPWLQILDKLQSMDNVTTIYPGHGSSGPSGLIAETSNYIQNFQRVIDSASSKGEAVQRMLALYPDYQLSEVLVASVHRMMRQ